MWEPVVRLLPEYDCITPSRPGAGGRRQGLPFTIERAAIEVAELIRAETTSGRACVVGLSLGAQILVQLLATEPACVEKAIISSALVRPLPGLGWASSPGILAWTYRATIAPFKNSDWWIRLNLKHAAGVPDQYLPNFKTDFQSTTEAEFIATMHANQRFRLPPGLERAVVPTLVLAGRREVRAMRWSARDLADRLPSATAGLVDPGGGTNAAQQHNWALTAPELFANTVRAWIDGTPLPPSIGRLDV